MEAVMGKLHFFLAGGGLKWKTLNLKFLTCGHRLGLGIGANGWEW
jgi:hypothetical protein